MVREFVSRILKRTHAYRGCFQKDQELTPEARVVLKDLAKFCRAHTATTIVSPVTRCVDPLATMQAEGRREVYNRILWHLKIDDADLLDTKEDTYE